jgi:DNA helicase HerA-like ATPase
MVTDQGLIIGGDGGVAVLQLAAMSNRHGLIAGATGTGKTVTLQVLAEGFSQLGVPVFAADVKGDLSGIATAGSAHAKIDERLARLPLPDYRQQGSPVLFWDVYGESGHPIRTTVSEMGPLLLASLLQLNDNQEGLLYAAFSIADDEGLLMLDLKDLRAMLAWMGEHAGKLRSEYGNISPQSIGAIQRRLLVLQEQGGDRLFGEPAVTLDDLMQVDFSGRGVISLLDASRLIRESPRVYTAFLLWLLAELFEQLPEQGDADRPSMVFFFDEAHLLFEDAPKALLDKVEQVVRLVRSKGVGVFFVTQSPMDIPEDVLGQLGLKVQHALRAFTPKDRKAIKLVAQNFRNNPDLDTETLLTELGTGEALVSALDAKGRPEPVRRTLIAPPESRIGPLAPEERAERLRRSPLRDRYDQVLDRESAYEVLAARAEASAVAAQQDRDKAAQPRRSSRQSVAEAFAKSTARSIGNQIGRALARGLLGSLFGTRRR